MIRSTIFINQTIALINHYGFDLEQSTAKYVIVKWLKNYEHSWLYLAVIEAIYQGRLKAISVEQILSFWLRKGKPSYHFTREFENLICTNVTPKVEDMISLDEYFCQVTNNHSQINHLLNSSVQKNKDEENNCLSVLISPPPISQFKPLENHSYCYSKLKALADIGELI